MTRALVLLLPLLLTACPGGGPLGNGLGEVTAVISVKQADNTACTATLTNGKDQTNLEVEDLSLCGGHLGRLHADKSDGAKDALSAMVAQTQSRDAVLPGIFGAAICEAVSAVTGKPCVSPPAPK